MAAINRFTNIDQSQNAYTPRSFEELLKPAAYMRGKHDELLASKAKYDQQIAQLAETDPLYAEMMAKESEGLSGQLESYADQLNREGFGQAAKSNFLDFNKQYQTNVGPRGTIGKIQSATKSINDGKTAYIQDAIKRGVDPTAAKLNWEDHYKGYADTYGETQIVQNIDPLYGHKYKNVVDEFRSYIKDLGYSSSDIAAIASSIEQDAKGSYVLNSKGREKFGNNFEALRSLENYINDQIANPESEIGQSLSEQRVSQEEALNRIKGLAPIFEKDEYVRETGDTVSGYKAATKTTDSGNGFTLGEYNTTFKDVKDRGGNKITNFKELMAAKRDAEAAVKKLDGSQSPQDKEAYAQANGALTRINPLLNEIYEKNPRLKEAQDKLDGRQSILDTINTSSDVVDIMGVVNSEDTPGDLLHGLRGLDKFQDFYKSDNIEPGDVMGALIAREASKTQTKGGAGRKSYTDVEINGTGNNVYDEKVLEIVNNPDLGTEAKLQGLKALKDTGNTSAGRFINSVTGDTITALKADQADVQGMQDDILQQEFKNNKIATTQYVLQPHNTKAVGTYEAQKKVFISTLDPNSLTFVSSELPGMMYGTNTTTHGTDVESREKRMEAEKEMFQKVKNDPSLITNLLYTPIGSSGNPEFKVEIKDESNKPVSLTFQSASTEGQAGFDKAIRYFENMLVKDSPEQGRTVVEAGDFFRIKNQYGKQKVSTFASSVDLIAKKTTAKQPLTPGENNKAKFYANLFDRYLFNDGISKQEYANLTPEERKAILDKFRNTELNDIY
jgi:hypothetical protein